MRERRSGFTLMEAMVAVALVGVMAGLAAAMMRGSLGDSRAKGGARNLADLLMLARAEAIRTTDPHLVFFEADAEAGALTGPSGQPAAALLVRDLNGDGKVQAGEKVAAVNLDQTGSLSWGAAFAGAAAQKAPNDNPAGTFPATDPAFTCCTFTEPDGDPARWVMFQPDGTPRSFSINPFAGGAIASGNGGVYVSSGSRDFSVVLAPLGGIRVHAWERGANQWTR